MSFYFDKSNYFIFIVSILILWLLSSFGFNFPIPWGDESVFLFQANSVYENNTLFTESLSDNRVIMWMQPGYMIFLGLVYKIFGFSFELSRMISWFMYIASFIIFSITIRKYIGVYALFIVAIVFLSPTGLAIANIARMDSFILFFLSISLYALLEKRYILSLSIILLGLLFHFNMIYMFIPYFGAIALELKDHRQCRHIFKATKTEYAFLLVVVFLLIAYAYFISINLDSYIHDMAFQFERKLSRTPFYHRFKNIIAVGVMVLIAMAYFYFSQRKKMVLILFSLSLFLLSKIGQEMWYLFFLLLSEGTFVILLFDYLKNNYIKLLLVTGFFVFLAISAMHGFKDMYPIFYGEKYISNATKKEIENKILNIKRQQNIDNMKITFFSKGADLLFVDFAKENNIKIIHKLPEKIEKLQPVDLMIYITRPQDPQWLIKYQQIIYKDGQIYIVSEKNNDTRVINTK
jgi:hypothetical protein